MEPDGNDLDPSTEPTAMLAEIALHPYWVLRSRLQHHVGAGLTRKLTKFVGRKR